MNRTLFIPMMVVLAVMLAGCDNEGPAERAGERIDEVAEDIRDNGEDLGNEIEDACEEIKEGMGAEDKDC
jgi:hypothetical protein